MRTMKLCFVVLIFAFAAADDCSPFKMECQKRCIAHSNGVSTNQCWGSPRYRLCKCSDSTILSIPGFSCDHPTCPNGGNAHVNIAGASAPAPTPPPPTPKPTPSPLCSFCGSDLAVSGLSAWEVGKSLDGTQVSTINNNVVVCAESHSYAYASFKMGNPGKSYATIDVALRNRAEAANGLTLTANGDYSADISNANGVVLTYQSSVDMYLQIRHAGNKHGGHHYRILLPAHPTMTTANLPFSEFAQPSWAAQKYDLNLKDVFSFTFVATQDGGMLVHSLLLSTSSGGTISPQPATGASCTAPTEAACPWERNNRCMARRPALGGIAAPPTPAPTISVDAVQGHVQTAAREAVRLKNLQGGPKFTFHSVLTGSEQRVQGYNYQIRMVVGMGSGGTTTVDVVVATTTYRDIYRLVSWGGQAAAGGDVYATQPSTAGGDVYATQPTSTNWNGGGDVYASKPAATAPASIPASAGSVTGHAAGMVITPLGAERVYNAPYKARGQYFPFITEDGDCVDIATPWPKGYMPCCPGCHSAPCQSCFKQPSGHYV